MDAITITLVVLVVFHGVLVSVALRAKKLRDAKSVKRTSKSAEYVENVKRQVDAVLAELGE